MNNLRMRVGLLVAVGFMVLLPAQQPDAGAAAGEPVQIRIDGLPAQAYVQQELLLVVRLEIDTAWFQAHGVPLFQQTLDQPFHLLLPWLQAGEDRAVEVVPPPPGTRTQKVAVGDRVLPLRRTGEPGADAARTVLELHCRWLPLAAGTSSVAPVQVRYAFATRFEQDFLRGRTPADRQEATIASAAQQLRVLPLPSPAPAGFGGAVGTFSIRLLPPAAPIAAAVGASLSLSVEVTGNGNLDRFAALSPPLLDGFHCQGVVDRKEAGRRVFTLDLLPLREGAQTVPPVPFLAFDPQRGQFATLHSEPLPVVVGPAAAPLPPRVQELVQLDAQRLAARAAWPAWVWAVALAAVLLAALLLRAAAHRRLRQQRSELGKARCLASLPHEPMAALAALDELLAAAAGLPQWPGGDGFAALSGRGLSAAAIAALQQVRQQLDAARFGGAVPARAAVEQALAAL